MQNGPMITLKSGMQNKAVYKSNREGDKKIIHAETRSFYGELLEAGVKIFEYTPGFLHTKALVSDDKFCYIGSANFDFRSFIWNYECGVWFYKNSTVLDCKDDFLQTQEASEEITINNWGGQNIVKNAWHAFLRLVSPLL